MNLKKLKTYFESFSPDHQFEWALSEPFSWRGSYDEVAFSIEKQQSTAEQNLQQIKKAYIDLFCGWKGGEYEYCDWTPVNFESHQGSWSDGEYASQMIAKIEQQTPYLSQEHRLVSLAFN